MLSLLGKSRNGGLCTSKMMHQFSKNWKYQSNNLPRISFSLFDTFSRRVFTDRVGPQSCIESLCRAICNAISEALSVRKTRLKIGQNEYYLTERWEAYAVSQGVWYSQLDTRLSLPEWVRFLRFGCQTFLETFCETSRSGQRTARRAALFEPENLPKSFDSFCWKERQATQSLGTEHPTQYRRDTRGFSFGKINQEGSRIR